MNKKVLLLLAIIVIAIATYMFLRPSMPTVSISRIYNLTEVGETIEINITISDVPSLFMWVIDLTWDPYILQITTGDHNGLNEGGIYYNIYEGPFLASINRTTIFTFNHIFNNQGKIQRLACGYSGQTGETASGTGVLATINFTCIHVGTTTIEMIGPSVSYPEHSEIQDHTRKEIPHGDMNGIATEHGPPPVWMQSGVLTTIIIVEIIVLVPVSYIVIRMKRPQPRPKSQRNTEAR